ncbi:MAG: insulinase family protein [Nevskiaceae bacterium]|nr:MAG: insulinase family protein [Nevskiaceae bacterium]TBR72513.1 MAG: insulinase family protein [Nevskiaceae bacterium]
MFTRRPSWARSVALCCVLSFAWLPAVHAASDAGADIARTTLDNGLRVVVVRNPLAPVVTTQMSYLVGSNEAPKGFPGTAHAMEHMMFRGSPGLSQNQLAEIAALLGGSFNAFTTQTVTQYYYSVPAADLDVALHIAAARMRGLTVADKDWAKERGAIEQEVSRNLSNPGYHYYKQLLAAMFAGTPYAHDALGTRPSFNKTSAKMLRDFHTHWYAPNNAIFVIVGDVDPAQVVKRVKALFAAIPAKKLPARPAVKLQPVKAQTLELKTDRPYGTVAIAWRLPGYHSPDYAASVILGDVLDSRRGRLNALVPEGKALAAGFDQNAFQDTGVGFADAIFAPGQDAHALMKELAARVAEVRRKGVDADLLAAAKRQEIAQLEKQKTSITGLASAWSTALAFQDLNAPEDLRAAFEAVTVEDVNRLAQKLFDPQQAISAILTPEPSGKPVASSGFGGAESFAPQATKAEPLPTWAKYLTKVPAVPESALQPSAQVLPNGIKLIVQPEPVAKVVSLYGSIRTRDAMQEPQGQDGVGTVLDRLFGYGGGTLDRSAFQAALDDIAAQEHGGSDFSLIVPAEHFDRGVELLALNQLQPRTPEKAFKVVQQQVSGALAGMLQSPGYLARRALREGLYPKGDPNLRQATPKTVDALTLDDVRAYYTHTFRPDETTIVVIGDTDAARARKVVEKYFGAWKAHGEKPNLDLPAVPNNKPGTHWVPDKSAVQDSVVLAQTLGVTLTHPDHYALDLGNVLLGQGFYASRLYRDLRANAGLVYTVGSNLNLDDTRSTYTIQFGSDPDKVAQARDIVVRDLADMQKNPVPATDLDRAKALMLRQLPLGHASFSSVAGAWLYYAQHNLPLNQDLIAAAKVRALSGADVQKAFAKWLRPKDLVQVVQGPKPE